jgi:hypothetical protein
VTALLLLLAWSDVIAVDGVVIASDSPCPSAVGIHDALSELPHARLLSAAAAVKADDDEVTVELTAPGRSGRAIRRLSLEGDCARRAESVALVIMAWADVAPAEPPPSPPLTLVSTAVAARPPAVPSYEVGLATLAAMDANGARPGLRLELSRTRRSSPFGWRLAAVAPAARRIESDFQTSSYTRLALSGSGLIGAQAGRIRTEADLGPVLALTRAWGEDFSVNRTSSGLVPGATLGGRVGLAGSRVSVWLELRIVRWLAGQTIAFAGPHGAGRVPLPNDELHLSLGVSVRLPEGP